MAASVVRVGDIGAGNIAKLANQVVVALNIALAVALVFTAANRGRFVAWLGALGKSGMAATARKEAKKLRSRVDELKLKDSMGKLSQVEKSELSSSVKNLPQLESKVQKLEADKRAADERAAAVARCEEAVAMAESERQRAYDEQRRNELRVRACQSRVRREDAGLAQAEKEPVGGAVRFGEQKVGLGTDDLET